MKAIEFIEKLCEENLDLTQCHVVDGGCVYECGLNSYFGLPLYEGKIECDATYFYVYCEWDCAPNSFGEPAAIFGDEDEICWCYLYELEN